MDAKPGRFGVLIPAYNAAQTIEAVIFGARQASVGPVVVVDDGSQDETRALASAAADIVLGHQTNRGKGAALNTGLSWLKAQGYEAAITLDADGQHPPEHIPSFVARYEKTGCDLVIGTRPFSIHQMPLLRHLGNRLSSFFVSLLCRRWISDSQCGFRLYKLSSLPLDNLTTSGFEAETELLVEVCRHGERIEALEVPLIYCGSSASHFDQLRDTLKVTRVIVRYLIGCRL